MCVGSQIVFVRANAIATLSCEHDEPEPQSRARAFVCMCGSVMRQPEKKIRKVLTFCFSYIYFPDGREYSFRSTRQFSSSEKHAMHVLRVLLAIHVVYMRVCGSIVHYTYICVCVSVSVCTRADCLLALAGGAREKFVQRFCVLCVLCATPKGG